MIANLYAWIVVANSAEDMGVCDCCVLSGREVSTKF
jgi:hypothetical protein